MESGLQKQYNDAIYRKRPREKQAMGFLVLLVFFSANAEGDAAAHGSSSAESGPVLPAGLDPYQFFVERTVSDAHVSPRRVITADVNSDGVMDVVATIAGQDMIVWYELLDQGSESPPEFLEHVIAADIPQTLSIFAVDIEPDGDIDILSVSWAGSGLLLFEQLPAEPGEPPQFQATTLDPTVSQPSSVIAFDVDGDGDADPICAAPGDHLLFWYEVTETAPIAVVRHPIQATVETALIDQITQADVDGDGDLDVLVATKHANFAWYENNREGWPNRFFEHVVSTENKVNMLQAADFDGDGDTDIVAVDGYELTMYRSNGAPSPRFTPHLLAGDLGIVLSLHVADVDRDGTPDILLGGGANGLQEDLHWYRNDGASPPGFRDTAVAVDAEYVDSIAAADVDDDGDIDVVAVHTRDEAIRWHAQDPCSCVDRDCAVVVSPRLCPIGEGFPQSWDFGPLPRARGDVTITVEAHGDFAADGSQLIFKVNGVRPPACPASGCLFDGQAGSFCPDAANPDVGQIVLPRGAFNRMVDGGNVVVTVEAVGGVDAFACRAGGCPWQCDEENDGCTPGAASCVRPECCEALCADPDDQPSFVQITLGYEQLGPVATCECVFDVDCDDGVACTHDSCVFDHCVNDPDDAVCGEGEYCDPTGDCQEVVPAVPFVEHPIAMPLSAQIVNVAADFDNDGDVDLLGRNSVDDTVGWYENDGASPPNFIQHIIADDGDPVGPVGAADFNGDGRVDVVVAGGNLRWFENQGGEPITFVERFWSPQTEQAYLQAPADIDGDGDVDLFVVEYYPYENELSWFENSGTVPPQFVQHTIPVGMYESPEWIDATDVDGDGDMDVLTASQCNHSILWYDNQGGPLPEFVERTVFHEGEPTYAIGVDLDGDGDTDVMGNTGFCAGVLPWYENDGGHPPTFLRHLMSDWASLSRPIAADLNGDGRQDVIVGTQWFRNLGGNPPIFSDCYEAVAGDHFPRVAADLDQDGDTDVAGSYRHAPHEFAWLENSGHFVVHAGSALVHGEGGPNEAELTLNLDETGGIEPRLGGPQKLLIELDAHYNPSSFAREQVRVICSDYEPIVASVSPHTDSRTVVVELASPISSDECCTVHLGGIVSLDRVAVTSPYRLGVLEGDTTGDGGVSGGDAASIRPWFGVVGPDGQPNPRYDVDRSGAITPADRDWVILRFGRTLPACP